MHEQFIKLDAIRFAWSEKAATLLGIGSFELNRVERVFLRGSSGSVKSTLLALIMGEAMVITLTGMALGIGLVAFSVILARDWIANSFGLFIKLNLLTPGLVYVVIAVAIVGCLIGLIPGTRMYRYSLADGITVCV